MENSEIILLLKEAQVYKLQALQLTGKNYLAEAITQQLLKRMEASGAGGITTQGS